MFTFFPLCQVQVWHPQTWRKFRVTNQMDTFTDQKMKINLHSCLCGRSNKHNLDQGRKLIIKKKEKNNNNQLTPRSSVLWGSRKEKQGLTAPRLHSWGTAGQLSPTWEDAVVYISGCRLTIGGWAGREGPQETRHWGCCPLSHDGNFHSLGRRKEKKEGSVYPPFSDTSPGS